MSDAPEPKIVRNDYVLAVHDLAVTRDWYERVLGCVAEDIDPGNWVFLRRDNLTFMVGHCPDAIVPADLGDHSYFAYLGVEGIDAWYARARGENVDFIKRLRTESWGMREFGMRTVDGHRIMVGEPVTAVSE